MDSIIAVRVTLETGQRRYFLTWGDLGSNRPWPGDIERAVLTASKRYALGGKPTAAKVCDSLQEASGERYFYECLTSMQLAMPKIGKPFWPWTDKMTAAVGRGEELHYCGLPREQQDPPHDPTAKFGYQLEWFPKVGDELAGVCDLPDLTPERLQELVGDPDVDRVMCLSTDVNGATLAVIAAGIGVSVDESIFDYYVSPWAERGFRTPGGYFPPPPGPPAPVPDAVRVRPR